jgi:transposase
MRVPSGERAVSPVTLPPAQICELRSLFTTYRFYNKQIVQLKNRIHSVLKERLYGFTQTEIFDKKSRKKILSLESGSVMSFQLGEPFTLLEFTEKRTEPLKEKIMETAEPYMREREILTSMKGVSVFTAIAVITDIIKVDRFKNSKRFASYLRSAPRVADSNTSVSVKGTDKKGRKLSSTLLTQSLNHVPAASEKLNKWYRRLCEYKKAGLVRTGLRRKVLTETYQMLRKGEYHYAGDEKLHELKISAYKKFLEKRKIIAKPA